ncbi:MAG: hypothetical protein U1C50_04380 [Patescibacteria group bacterium]|nr:hypothetical protein [Candidatus Beckwithbacteria bacterium]MDZ4229458.1 hypothetical protein [Patescibacteria group bacterium]
MGESVEQPRSELLQSGGNFTLSELNGFGLGPETRGKDGNIGRDMLYISEGVRLRQVPTSLLTSVKTNLENTHNIGQAIEPLWTSFYVYRECVTRLGELITPFVKKADGVWEWPDPADFSWGDEQTKTLAMLMGAYKKEQEATVSVFEGNVKHKLSLPSGVVSSETLSDLVAKPYEHIKFKIPVLSEVRILNEPAWQDNSRRWTSYLATAFNQFINQKPDSPKDEENIIALLDTLQKSVYEFPGVRYANSGEESNAQYLFTFNF